MLSLIREFVLEGRMEGAKLLLGRPFDEATLLRAARAVERELGPLPPPAPQGDR